MRHAPSGIMKVLTSMLLALALAGCWRGTRAPMQTAQGGGNNTGTGTMSNDTAMTGGTDPFGAGDDGTAPPAQGRMRPIPVEPIEPTPRP